MSASLNQAIAIVVFGTCVAAISAMFRGKKTRGRPGSARDGGSDGSSFSETGTHSHHSSGFFDFFGGGDGGHSGGDDSGGGDGGGGD